MWMTWLATVALAGLLAGDAGFLKGQLHLHTGNSGDSATPPADAARWYAARGYDFIVVTDHNVVTTVASPSSMRRRTHPDAAGRASAWRASAHPTANPSFRIPPG